MVGTVKFYLLEINKFVWVNCNNECIVISSEDSLWNDDGSDSMLIFIWCFLNKRIQNMLCRGLR